MKPMNQRIKTETEQVRSKPDGRRLLHSLLLASLAVCGFGHVAVASTITITGEISQSTQDGTGPAGNNPSLNAVIDTNAYLVTLAFAGSITGPGTYDLTGSSLTFSVPTAAAVETSFGLISLTVTTN